MVPGLDNLVPETVTLKQNATKLHGPAKHVLAAPELKINVNRGIGA